MDAVAGIWSQTRGLIGWLATGVCAAALAACGGGSDGIEGAQGVSQALVIGLPGDTAASLQWAASTDPRVTGYRVYVGNSSWSYFGQRGAGVDVGNATAFRFDNLQAGVAYYFAVTAYDAANNESGFSNEVAKLIQ